jgi:hypothetical protein
VRPKRNDERPQTTSDDAPGARRTVDGATKETAYFAALSYFEAAKKSFFKIFAFRAKKRRFRRFQACEERKKVENE